jgi:hypothetical protein
MLGVARCVARLVGNAKERVHTSAANFLRRDIHVERVTINGPDKEAKNPVLECRYNPRGAVMNFMQTLGLKGDKHDCYRITHLFGTRDNLDEPEEEFVARCLRECRWMSNVIPLELLQILEAKRQVAAISRS